jgi:glutamate carboxypeptidase
LSAGFLHAALIGRRERMLAQLAALVGIGSGSADGAGIDRVGDWLARAWAELGFAEERHAVGAAADLRLLWRRGGGRGRLLILGHMDTVWPAEIAAAWPFACDEAYAAGPGVGDMKGGLVVAHAAVQALIEAGGMLPAETRLVLVPDEELGSVRSRALIEAEALTADWVLVMEPARPDGRIIVGRGAVGAVVARAEGVSAHVLNRAAGASAVRFLAERVAALEALDGVSVGILRGGEARQVVPPSCEMHIDLRAPDAVSAENLLARVKQILAPPEGSCVACVLNGGITRPAFPRAASEALFARAARVAEGLGIAYGGLVTQGGSDGSFAASLGRPTLDGLGPVCFDTCSLRERIVIGSLAERAAVFAGLVTELAAHAQE